METFPFVMLHLFFRSSNLLHPSAATSRNCFSKLSFFPNLVLCFWVFAPIAYELSLCLSLWRSKEGISSLRSGLSDGLGLPLRYQESNSILLEEDVSAFQHWANSPSPSVSKFKELILLLFSYQLNINIGNIHPLNKNFIFFTFLPIISPFTWT